MRRSFSSSWEDRVSIKKEKLNIALERRSHKHPPTHLTHLTHYGSAWEVGWLLQLRPDLRDNAETRSHNLDYELGVQLII